MFLVIKPKKNHINFEIASEVLSFRENFLAWEESHQDHFGTNYTKHILFIFDKNEIGLFMESRRQTRPIAIHMAVNLLKDLR